MANSNVEAMLEALVPRREMPVLAEPIWYHLDTGGKRIRPALCLMVCDALGGDSERALHFAAAVELLHNMLLVHDDIEDGDTMRRNKPTVWKAYGLGNAINIGDYILALGLRAIMLAPVDDPVRLRLMDAYVTTYERTVEGQALDIAARCDEQFTVEKYLRMAELKTGHYLVLGMAGGAIIAGASELTLQVLWQLGRNLGPAFQIRDDLIDLTTGKGRGEKGSDIREGKASILYAHALSASRDGERSRLLEIMRKPREETTSDDVAWVMALYERSGSMKFAQETADRLVTDAHHAVRHLPESQQQALADLITYIAERKT